MKRAFFKSFILVAGLCAGFGFGLGCATDAPITSDDPTAQAATSETEQDIGGGGGSCPAKDNCYWLCRFQHPCSTTPSQCGPLADCLDRCDAEFPSC
jgi:hypothetical protein